MLFFNPLQGLDANGRPLLELHFRVQFYIESPLLLRDEISRHNYYLQLKENANNKDIPKDCSEQSLILLGALALQADLGDCPDDMTTDNFKFLDYIPSNLRTAWCTAAIQSCYKDYVGMSKLTAETNFIKEASVINDTINAHVFRMKLSKNESGAGSVWFIVYAKGIKVLGDNYPTTTFFWPNITKLSFERKKFEIKYGEDKTVLYSGSDIKNKALFALCKETHQFSMKILARLNEAMRIEEDECNNIPDCDMYSRGLTLPYKNKSDQRISVISSTSSNTTSGIVSDRVHSEDEIDIAINSTSSVHMSAQSTESLALAHLLDKPSVSRQTSSLSHMSLKKMEESFENISLMKASSKSGEAIVADPATAVIISGAANMNNHHNNIGSQCSSSCSTIVVASDTSAMSPAPGALAPARLRNTSASSSLELGFSHTAQNSAISESTTTSVDVLFSKIAVDDDEDNISGVYILNNVPATETSGVYTMTNSELTGPLTEAADLDNQQNSSFYDCLKPESSTDHKSMLTMDSVDGNYDPPQPSDVNNAFRQRSDSNISSTSFRGDGSDPTDKKQTLLSAEELTDLIVGRGAYPSESDNIEEYDGEYVAVPMDLTSNYLRGHNSETHSAALPFDEELLPLEPPTPPIRVDSKNLKSLTGVVLTPKKPMPLPPPYNASHETTGLRGPCLLPIGDDMPPNMLRDPPPYPQQPSSIIAAPLSKNIPSNHAPSPSSSVLPEEAGARFIKTRPEINILKAYTSVIGDNPKPCFASPTVPSISHTQPPITNNIGIPISPFELNGGYKHIAPKQAPHACVLLPVMPRQYLPPPPPTPRQPPPPPPQTTVYTPTNIARSQLELYQQQLYSDVDYVIYPLQDPAISQQEYLDAKQGSILAALAQSSPQAPYVTFHTGNAHPNPTWNSFKSHPIYRSMPYLSVAYSSHSHYGSTQNLSDTYVQLPSGAYSPLYSPSVASVCSSYDRSMHDAPPPPPLHPKRISTSNTFTRSRSDDNILKCVDQLPKMKRLPPPPPIMHSQKKPQKPPMPAPDVTPTVVPPTTAGKS